MSATAQTIDRISPETTLFESILELIRRTSADLPPT